MLKDITLGQYFPGESLIHRLDPRVKIVLVLLYMVFLFVVKNPLGYAVMVFWAVLTVMLSKIPAKMVIKSVRPMMFLIILTAVLNIFYSEGGRVLVSVGFITITTGGIITAALMVLRLVFLVIGTSVLTFTTSPIMLTDAIERLLGPLKVIRVPVHELAMIMTIALRMIPTLLEETEKIIDAQKSRGADFESGNLMRRVRALIPVLVPLFVSAFRRAGDLAVAMESRCYNGGEGRTRMKVMKMGGIDVVSLVFSAAMCGAVVAINMLL